ncbi:MAG TPA: AMP-binding protein, partial [Dongiaceae bacterium]|nr:AMP-binding protein [Dongiaceae bacterium]
MTEIKDGTTIAAAFAATAARHSDKPFFAVPAAEGRGYLDAGFEISYGEAARQVEALAAIYRAAGYGLGHHVATLLENRPDYVLHKLALNSIGACCVPINPEYRTGEIAYLLEHSEPELVIVLAARRQHLIDALPESARRPG